MSRNVETVEQSRGIRRHNRSNGRGAPTMSKDAEGYHGFQQKSSPKWTPIASGVLSLNSNESTLIARGKTNAWESVKVSKTAYEPAV